jgi:hypothetical protein
VLDGAWQILHWRTTSTPVTSASPVCRTISHVLSTTTSTTLMLHPTNRSKPLTALDRLPAHEPLRAVHCPTVYPSTPFVVCTLSLPELARAFDLPAVVQIDSPSHPGCCSAPAKLLYSVFHSFNFWGGGMLLEQFL